MENQTEVYLKTMYFFCGTLRIVRHARERSLPKPKRVKATTELLETTTIKESNFFSLNAITLTKEIINVFDRSERYANAYINELKRWCTSIDRSHESYIEWQLKSGMKETYSNRHEAKEAEQNSQFNEYIEIGSELVNVIYIWRGYEVFKQRIDQICEDWNFGRPLKTCRTDIYVSDYYTGTFHVCDYPNIDEIEQIKLQSSMVRNAKESQCSIEDIIPSTNKEQSKEIISEIMRGKRGKGACIAIRALIKSKVIRIEQFPRRAVYGAISDFIGANIGSDASINKYWADDTVEGEIAKICKQIEKIIKQ